MLVNRKAARVFKSLLLLVVVVHTACAQEPVLQQDLALKYLVQFPKEKTDKVPVILLLHGYGSDERDLFDLGRYFPARFLVVSARAPIALPGGGYQWYALNSGGTGVANYAEIENSRALLLKFIGQVVNKYHADAGQVYLAGFSQGAIMSYEAGLTAPEKVRGIAVLSGKIYPSLKHQVKITAALKRLEIYVAHGTADNRIPCEEGKAAVEYLEKLGLHPSFHSYTGMGHSISNDVLRDLLAWLH